jgi:hypothetical protein
MSVPRLSRDIWNEIKNAECIGWVEKGGNMGQWGWFIVAPDVVKVLFNNGGNWELIAWDDEPPRPPQGTMDPADFRQIKGGDFKPKFNAILRDGALWQIVHEEGSLWAPGRAIPVRIAGAADQTKE